MISSSSDNGKHGLKIVRDSVFSTWRGPLAQDMCTHSKQWCDARQNAPLPVSHSIHIQKWDVTQNPFCRHTLLTFALHQHPKWLHKENRFLNQVDILCIITSHPAVQKSGRGPESSEPFCQPWTTSIVCHKFSQAVCRGIMLRCFTGYKSRWCYKLNKKSRWGEQDVTRAQGDNGRRDNGGKRGTRKGNQFHKHLSPPSSSLA